MSVPEALSYLLVGGLSGLLAGLFGVGGGAVIVPALILIFTHIQLATEWIPHLAIGTSLATIIGTGAASTLAHHRRNGVRWDLFAQLTPGIVLGALAGASLVAFIPDLWLKRLFAAFLGFVGLKMLSSRSPILETPRPMPGRLGLGGVGGAIGMLSALVGIGGGTITVPFLNSRGIDMRKAVGTSAACGLPIAIAGTIGFVIAGWGRIGQTALGSGFVYWPAAITILVASMPVAPLGARLAHQLPVPVLKRIFGGLLILVAIELGLS
ncbi:sulfite exporter TauE/SafE family protein [Thiorhodococcus mannitoliphagus]|uniref:Probable membrane transporter protein n=1 Tax=Thiorhodococcus mannitoliphagus TaxID=329406 RepID=A0A6P1DVB3_9GAMM|nr:sulfite exporter TauE/SafE family protein [Thiorhodococcus mannitoliphagus]NEX20626.1 sulfite exporter TauE/SafE family protein [Thiorhodococcus mannitoliphagus]